MYEYITLKMIGFNGLVGRIRGSKKFAVHIFGGDITGRKCI